MDYEKGIRLDFGAVPAAVTFKKSLSKSKSHCVIDGKTLISEGSQKTCQKFRFKNILCFGQKATDKYRV